tara:strand:- start:3451 stop:3648 length:198 start_codon:yes stop_codon:yes gene_type:complete
MKDRNIIFERNGQQVYWRISGRIERHPIPVKLDVDGKNVSVDLAQLINEHIDLFTKEMIDKKSNG